MIDPDGGRQSRVRGQRMMAKGGYDMITSRLRKGDGIGQRAWLRSVVRNAQLGLVEAGQPMTVDGKFGSATAKAVRAFQAGNGHKASGVVGRETWGGLAPHLEKARAGDRAPDRSAAYRRRKKSYRQSVRASRSSSPTVESAPPSLMIIEPRQRFAR